MKIYDQHRAAFRKVASFAIIRDGQPVASIAIKYPRDGAGRLYAYLHWRGCHMARGFASGYGYDKGSAAVRNAAELIGWKAPGVHSSIIDFQMAMSGPDGASWQSRLERAGFTVFQTI